MSPVSEDCFFTLPNVCVTECLVKCWYILSYEIRHGKKQQGGIFSWTKRLVTRVVQRLLLLARPGPITAHWEVYQQKLQQNWKWSFLAPWDTMAMKCPQTRVKFMTQRGSANWKLHLPSASTKIKSLPLQAADLQGQLKGVQGGDQK